MEATWRNGKIVTLWKVDAISWKSGLNFETRVETTWRSGSHWTHQIFYAPFLHFSQMQFCVLFFRVKYWVEVGPHAPTILHLRFEPPRFGLRSRDQSEGCPAPTSDALEGIFTPPISWIWLRISSLVDLFSFKTFHSDFCRTEQKPSGGVFCRPCRRQRCVQVGSDGHRAAGHSVVSSCWHVSDLRILLETSPEMLKIARFDVHVPAIVCLE